MPFTFNTVDLHVMTVNDKPWTHAREVCKAPKYNKKTANIVKNHCSTGNYAQKCQLNKVPTAGTTVNWSKDSRKDDYYISEEGMYKLIFRSQRSKAKNFRKHCCNVMFPHILQQLTSKTEEDYQEAIEEKDTALALLHDDLQNRGNQIKAIQYENVALQAQRDVYQTQLQSYQDQIHDPIINRHVPRTNDPGKDNIVMIIEKNTTPEEDEFYEYPYYIARIIVTKRRWFRAQYPHGRAG